MASKLLNSPKPAYNYHHGDLRNALIAAGRKALETVGAGELSLRQIAQSVGVSATAPARHFEGKDEFLAAIATDGFQDLTNERLQVAASEMSKQGKAFEMMLLYVRFAQRSKGLFNLMVGLRILQRDDYPELLEISSKSFELFERSIRDIAIDHGWKQKDLALLTYASWSVEHGLATLLIGDRIPRAHLPLDPESAIRFSLSLLLAAICAGPTVLRDFNQILAVPPPPPKSVR